MKSNSSVECSRGPLKVVKLNTYLGLPKLKGTAESSLAVTVLPQTGAASTLVSKGDSEIKHIVSSTKCQPRGSSAETLNRQQTSSRKGSPSSNTMSSLLQQKVVSGCGCILWCLGPGCYLSVLCVLHCLYCHDLGCHLQHCHSWREPSQRGIAPQLTTHEGNWGTKGCKDLGCSD